MRNEDGREAGAMLLMNEGGREMGALRNEGRGEILLRGGDQGHAAMMNARRGNEALQSPAGGRIRRGGETMKQLRARETFTFLLRNELFLVLLFMFCGCYFSLSFVVVCDLANTSVFFLLGALFPLLRVSHFCKPHQRDSKPHNHFETTTMMKQHLPPKTQQESSSDSRINIYFIWG
jgi:hypothetical protein